jgi:hypothetical protein
VALSSRRVWILLASVVALGIVLVGAVAFASPKKDAVNHENGKGRTLTVVIKSREAAVVDVGERGLSALARNYGDVFGIMLPRP